MISASRSRLLLVWAALLFATSLSLATARNVGLDDQDIRSADVLVIVIAFLKVRYVGLEFMELRRAPLPARIVFELWVVGTAAAIATVFVTG